MESMDVWFLMTQDPTFGVDEECDGDEPAVAASGSAEEDNDSDFQMDDSEEEEEYSNEDPYVHDLQMYLAGEDLGEYMGVDE